MSGSSKRRRSKWDEDDSQTLPDDSTDRAPPPRPRETSSPCRGSHRHDSRSRQSTTILDREGISPKLEECRPRHSTRSPRNERGRSHRISRSRSRSRSRSQSPAHHFKREPPSNDRSKNRRVCRDFIAGRCRKGHNCHFIHQDDQSYDNKRPLESLSSDEPESRHRRAGSSRHFPDDIKDNPIRPEKSTNICNDYLKGRCRRGDMCRYTHHDNRDHDNRNNYQDLDRRSRDSYPEHDRDVDKSIREPYLGHEPKSREPYSGHDPKSREPYTGHDHRRKDTHRERDYESDVSRKGEIPCKYFASGNCRSGSRCRFSHQVQESFSPERSQDDKRVMDFKSGAQHGWDGPSWGDETFVLTEPSLPGWEEDKNESKEVNTSRVQDNEMGPEFKNEVDRVLEMGNDLTGNQPGFDSLGHNVVIEPTSIDKFEIREKEDPLPITGFSGDMEISPRDIKEHTVFNPTSQTPSISNMSFDVGDHENVNFNSIQNQATTIPQGQDVFPPYEYDNFNPIPNTTPPTQSQPSSIVQNQATTIPQGQNVFPPYENDNFNPIPNKTPPTQSQPSSIVQNQATTILQGEDVFPPYENDNFNPIPNKSPPTQREPSSIVQNQTTIPQGQDVFPPYENDNFNPIPNGTPPAQSQPSHILGNVLENGVVGPESTVSNEQLARLSHLTASLSQLIENRQHLSQLSSTTSGATNLYDTVGTNIEPKLPNSGNQSIPSVVELKDEENGKEKVGPTAIENGPSRALRPDDGVDDGKKVKDTKGIRPFKFALAEFVKEVLKPFWKEGQVSKEAYKMIVKKAVDKVMETLGTQIPQTKEKIDTYLSYSKPKIEKLVQAYVGKHQKG